ncbi:hypothetical protein IWQ61_003361 [Dispira simplex]|nr:hypothetical protein IWQ61_003361 [Dispira simplex]
MSASSPRSSIPRRAVSIASGHTGDSGTTVTPATNTDNARRRQTRRDEAIRKKAEQELLRKSASPKNRHHQRMKRGVPGTVSSLQPSLALTVRQTMTIQEAAQLMAAKRADSVLVVDNDERLAGIFTAKDVAFRVVAEGMDARATLVAQIMTQNPLCVTSDTSATDALNTMVSRGFRHLPVCNDEGDVVGLLDVIKCMYEALDKMERAYGSSRKLYDALEGVEKEWSVHPAPLMQFVDALRERMSCPDLTSVLGDSEPVVVSPRTSVREVANQMRNQRTTAALIVEESARVAGIFTSKDIVLRVIAAGLDPSNCSVVRVMTPHPDTALPTTTVMDALKRMYEHHYLNLPVVSEEGEIMGMVDVLSLCYTTLELMKSIQGQDAEGPMWSRFFGTGGPHEAENESIYSDSMVNSSHHPSAYHMHSDIYPHESVSVAEDIASAVNSRIGDESHVASTAAGAVPSTLFEEGQFIFKFKAPTGKVHRFTANYHDLGTLLSIVVSKLSLDGVENPQQILSETGLCYLDDESDHVLLSSDQDLLDAVGMARSHRWPRLVLALNPNTASQPDLSQPLSTTGVAPPTGAVLRSASSIGGSGIPSETGPLDERQANESGLIRSPSDRSLSHRGQDADEGIHLNRRNGGSKNHGIPDPWVIPAAIGGGFLAALIGVVIILKATK